MFSSVSSSWLLISAPRASPAGRPAPRGRDPGARTGTAARPRRCRAACPATPSASRMSLISCAAFLKRPAFGDTAPRMPTMPASECFGESRRVEPVVAGGGAEVPHPRLAVAGQQAPARELVARPFADDGAREIADVVLVEDEDGAQPRARQRLAGAAQPVGVQAAEIDALLEVHLHVAGSLERPVPAVARVHVLGRHGPGHGSGLRGIESSFGVRSGATLPRGDEARSERYRWTPGASWPVRATYSA